MSSDAKAKAKAANQQDNWKDIPLEYLMKAVNGNRAHAKRPPVFPAARMSTSPTTCQKPKVSARMSTG
jgi:hypothetical protein